jgi:hypothetical protein
MAEVLLLEAACTRGELIQFRFYKGRSFRLRPFVFESNPFHVANGALILHGACVQGCARLEQHHVGLF